MLGLAVLVLSILYLVGLKVGTALAICSIAYVAVAKFYKKTVEERERYTI